jgi:hypothetical protein
MGFAPDYICIAHDISPFLSLNITVVRLLFYDDDTIQQQFGVLCAN